MAQIPVTETERTFQALIQALARINVRVTALEKELDMNKETKR